MAFVPRASSVRSLRPDSDACASEWARSCLDHGNRAVSTNLYFREKNFRIFMMRKFRLAEPAHPWVGCAKFFSRPKCYGNRGGGRGCLNKGPCVAPSERDCGYCSVSWTSGLSVVKPSVLTGNTKVHLCVPQSANKFCFACGASVLFFCRAQESADPDLLVCLSVADSMSDRRWFWMFTPQNGWSQHWHSLWRSLELIRREASVEEPAVLPQTSTSVPPGTSSAYSICKLSG